MTWILNKNIQLKKRLNRYTYTGIKVIYSLDINVRGSSHGHWLKHYDTEITMLQYKRNSFLTDTQTTFSRSLWVWPSPHSSHSHKLNRIHFHLLELSPQHNKQTTTEMISIQIIVQACSLSSTLGRQGYNASVEHLRPIIRPFILPLLIYLPKLWESP